MKKARGNRRRRRRQIVNHWSNYSNLVKGGQPAKSYPGRNGLAQKTWSVFLVGPVWKAVGSFRLLHVINTYKFAF